MGTQKAEFGIELSKRLKKNCEINLEGLEVNHKSLGKGRIVRCEKDYLYISFNGIEKQMSTSFCFSKELIDFEDKVLSNIIYNEYKKIAQELLNKKKESFYSNIKAVSKKLNSQKPNNVIDKESFEKLDDQQKKALSAIENTNGNYFITGKAGSGKSYILNYFRKATKKKVLMLAPTGVAALNIKGVTIHSAFGFYNLNNVSVDDILPSNIRLKSERRKVLKAVNTIIIDEISMVRADWFEKIDKILKIVNNTDVAFGGKQVIVCGDLFQLPPVVNSAEKDFLFNEFGGIYFFNSNAYIAGNFNFIELTQNHRQGKDFKFYETLNHIRENKLSDNDISLLNERVILEETAFDGCISIVTNRAIADNINNKCMSQLEDPEYNFNWVIVDCKDERLQNRDNLFPINKTLTLHKGAQVMMVINDPNGHWVNGTLGIVENIKNDKIAIAINGRSHWITPERFAYQEAIYENKRIEYVDAFVVDQYPIIPAYAITIHKSQGQTYENVICDVKDCFAAGQAYVALSRCTSLNGLHLRTPIGKKCVFVDSVVLDFYKQQKNIVETANDLNNANVEYHNF